MFKILAIKKVEKQLEILGKGKIIINIMYIFINL